MQNILDLVPKALLQLTVLILGFIIITVALVLTKIVVRTIEKYKQNKKKN